jgi:hypothetical protein
MNLKKNIVEHRMYEYEHHEIPCEHKKIHLEHLIYTMQTSQKIT